MKILYITNVYPSKYKNKSPIVKNIINQYKQYYPHDSVNLLLFDRLNFFKNLFLLRSYIKSNTINIVHIHFGGLYAFIIILFLFYTNTKVIITFHGTDIHGKLHTNGYILQKIKIKINKFFSLLSFPFVDKIDFVSNSLKDYIPFIYDILFQKKYTSSVLGVDYDCFKPINIIEAKKELNLNLDTKYILFINNNNSPVKREKYARELIEKLGKEYKILKPKNISYEKIPLYFNASTFLIVTSENEGSPNIIREAIATNLPIVSVDVGDVKEYIDKITSSIIIDKYNQSNALEEIINNIDIIEKNDSKMRSNFEKLISYKYTSMKLNYLYKLILEETNEK